MDYSYISNCCTNCGVTTSSAYRSRFALTR